MTDKTLCIEIFQPFAQYRNPFTFYYAQTFPLPPKSTIIGMLQNAVGDWYGHKGGVNNWWNLKISIHGGFESIFWNYQNLIKGELILSSHNYKLILTNKNDSNKKMYNVEELPVYGSSLKSQRSPVYQQELFNGHLWIFVKGEEGIINEIKNALEKPNKVLTLGRSEDVIFIKNVALVNYQFKEVPKNMWLKYPTFIKFFRDKNKDKKFPLKNQKYPVYSIPTKVLFQNNGMTISSKAELTKETKREPEFETVIYTGFDYPIYLKDTVNVDYFEINGKTFKIPTDYGWL